MPDREELAYVVMNAEGPEEKVPLVSGYSWKIGRDPRSEIIIRDPRVSRHHASIQRGDAGDFFLIDMGSRNGSFVNERRVSTPMPLRDGDKISIGGYPLVFRAPALTALALSMSLAVSELTQAWFVSRVVSVLVVDIRDFTKLAQQIDASVLSRVIGTWFKQAGGIMEKHGCWTLKYIGDAVMALWMHGQEGSEHRQILSALQAVTDFAECSASVSLEHSLPTPLRIGAGLNTGTASVGNAGSGSVVDYTAFGDAVNAAFRIESSTKDLGCELAIGSATFDALEYWADPRPYFEQRSVRLKGYEAPADVWATSFESVRRYLTESAASVAGE